MLYFLRINHLAATIATLKQHVRLVLLNDQSLTHLTLTKYHGISKALYKHNHHVGQINLQLTKEMVCHTRKEWYANC